MKKKIFLSVPLCLILGYILLYLIIPQMGRPNPNSKSVLIRRIERLEKWREGTLLYIEDINVIPKSLFEVYSYCDKNQKGIKLRLVSLPNISLEESLLKDEMILKNQMTFIQNIDYEIVHSQKDWYIREKKVYPKYLRKSDFLTIDSEGNIYENSLENLGVVLIDDLSDEKTY